MTWTNYRPPRIAFAFLGIAAFINFAPFVGSLRFTLPGTGFLLGAAGFAIMMWAWALFQRHEVAVCPTDPTARLITNGIYGATRNPMYLGMALMLLGLALYVGTAPFYAAALGWSAIMNWSFCPYEEARLEDAFGAEYLRYRARMRRWL